MLEESMKMNVDEYLPLRDVVFNTLRQAILTGDFLPGERLMEITLAKRLGVSRTPVREAIRKLELEGLVDMIPRKGAAVARITVSDLKDVLEVRCHLEEFAASIACDRITEEEKAYLLPAKLSALTMYRLLRDNAAQARQLISDYQPPMSVEAYREYAKKFEAGFVGEPSPFVSR